MTSKVQKVSTRKYTFRSLVEQSWGSEYNKPDMAYRFSNGRKFDDPKKGGPYGPK